MDDLISRQAAIDAICRDGVRLERGGALIITISTAKQWAVDLLEELPSAQHEPHEGHWIPVHPIQSDDPGAYMCSKCKTGMWEIRPSAYHYCPNCGARMDEEIEVRRK